MNILRKTNVFSQEEATFSTFWEIFLIQLHPTTNFLSLADIKKSQFFFQKPIYFTWKNQILNILRNFFHSAAFYIKFDTFSNFSLEKVFVRNEPISFFKAPNVWTFWRFILDQLHCSASLPHLAVLKKIHKFFEKPIYFLKQKT